MLAHWAPRVLIKLSGEMLGKTQRDGSVALWDSECVGRAVSEIVSVIMTSPGTYFTFVVGGGNITRGRKLLSQFPQPETRAGEKEWAHSIGKLAMGMNAFMLMEQLQRRIPEVPIRHRSNIAHPALAETLSESWGEEREILKESHLVLSTAQLMSTSDGMAVTAAGGLRINTILKGTKVDGVYDADPVKDTRATLLRELEPREFVKRDLCDIFDPDAVLRAGAHGIRILVFNFAREGNLRRALEYASAEERERDTSFLCSVIEEKRHP